RFSSEGQSILLISNIVLFILVVIFVSKRFDYYSNAKYKTVCWCINFGKFWIVVWWQNQWRKPALSSVRKVFKIHKRCSPFKISHCHKTHCYEVGCFCSIRQKLFSCVKRFVTDSPFFRFVHQNTSCVMFCS